MKNLSRLLLVFAFVCLAVASSQVASASFAADTNPASTAAIVPPFVPNAQGCNGQPTVQYAYANPPTISSGQVTTIYWGLVGNANAAYLQYPDGHRTGIGTPGSQQVNPTQTSTYTVLGVCGNVQTPVPVTVTVNGTPTCQGQPQMNGFTANPTTIQNGQTSTLNWGPVLNANYVQLSSQTQGGSGVPAPGSVGVTPSQTTTYYLTAWCSTNTATLQVTVNVSNPPPPTPPPASASVSSITKNGKLSNSGQLVVDVTYSWNGADGPAVVQATAYNGGGGAIGTSNATKAVANPAYPATLNMKPYPNGMTKITACIIGHSGTELACQTTGMQ